MNKHTERILTADTIVTVETIVRTQPRTVDWADIVASVESDDDMGAPWKEHDGWEHSLEPVEDPRANNSAGYIYRSLYDSWADDRYRGAVVKIDDDTLAEWGHVPHAGEAKQVFRERMAEVRREAVKHLVKWHTEGADWFGAVAEFKGYRASVWGILGEYSEAQEMAETEQRAEVAAQLEAAGYIVTGTPAEIGRQYTAADRLRDKIKRQLNG